MSTCIPRHQYNVGANEEWVLLGYGEHLITHTHRKGEFDSVHASKGLSECLQHNELSHFSKLHFLAKSHQKPIRNPIHMVNSLHCRSSACNHTATNVCPCQSRKFWEAYYIRVRACTCPVFLRLMDDSGLIRLGVRFCSSGHRSCNIAFNKSTEIWERCEVAEKMSESARNTPSQTSLQILSKD